MDYRIKALIVLIPFGIAGYVGAMMLQPAMGEASTKQADVDSKKKDSDALEAKLAGSGKVSQQAIEIRQQIDKLRDSVPKSPDTDLLTIDLEKMCKDAGMNMIGLTSPKDGSGGAVAKAVEDATKKKQDKLKNMLKGGKASADTVAEAGGGAGAEGGLEHMTKQFIVSGDFAGLQTLVHELETYQRVLKIDSIAFHIPKKDTAKGQVKIDEAVTSEGEDPGDPRLMFITMSISTYYLP